MAKLACEHCEQALRWVQAKDKEGVLGMYLRCPECRRLYVVELVEIQGEYVEDLPQDE